MSKSRDEYYEFKKEADLHHEGLRDRSYEYILELEAEKAELMEIANEFMGLLLNGELHDFFNERDLKYGREIEKILNKYKPEGV